jgi:hypothetical protein
VHGQKFRLSSICPQHLLNPNHNLFITLKNTSEFLAVTSKQKNDSETSRAYQEIKTLAKILFPNENRLSIFEKLIQAYQSKGNHVFDAEMVSIRLDNGINHIVTSNKKILTTFLKFNFLKFPENVLQ